jgi:hypothetical protein
VGLDDDEDVFDPRHQPQEPQGLIKKSFLI